MRKQEMYEVEEPTAPDGFIRVAWRFVVSVQPAAEREAARHFLFRGAVTKAAKGCPRLSRRRRRAVTNGGKRWPSVPLHRRQTVINGGKRWREICHAGGRTVTNGGKRR